MSPAMADLVRTRRERPAEAYISLVEAASFLAFGAYLTKDDLAALFCAHVRDGGGDEPTGSYVDEDWARASAAILARAGAGALTLYGRRAPTFGADPIGEVGPIALEFFAAELAVGQADDLFVRHDARRAMYCEIKIATDEFLSAFPRPRAKRAASAADRLSIRERAEAIYTETGRAPSERALSNAFPQVSRSSLRAAIDGLEPHLRRARGQ